MENLFWMQLLLCYHNEFKPFAKVVLAKISNRMEWNGTLFECVYVCVYYDDYEFIRLLLFGFHLLSFVEIMKLKLKWMTNTYCRLAIEYIIQEWLPSTILYYIIMYMLVCRCVFDITLLFHLLSNISRDYVSTISSLYHE